MTNNLSLDSHFIARSQLLASMASLFVMVVGLMVMVGWARDIPLLKGVYADINMKPNAALCLFFSGLSLWICNKRSTNILLQLVGALCAVLVAATGVLTLSEHIVGWDLGIDTLLFSEPPGIAATVSPGRMGPPASVCFMLVGMALVLFQVNRAINLAQLFSTVVSLLTLFVLIGYAYHQEVLYSLSRYTGIAIQTAISLFMLSLGLLATQADKGFVSVMSSRKTGSNMARRLILVAVVAPILLGWLRLWGESAGYFDTGMGTTLLVIAIVVTFTFVSWQSVAQLNKTEAERLAAEEMARETEGRFQIMADHAPVLIWVAAAEGQRIWVNKPWLDFTGSALDRELAKGWMQGMHPEDVQQYLDAYRIAFNARQPFTIEYRLKKYTGEYRWMMDTGSPRFLSSDQFVGYVGSCIDITDRKHDEEELKKLYVSEQQARTDAERASRLKDEFLATVSHELRTPLTAILGWTTLLRMDKIEEDKRQRAIETIERNAKAQAQLIEDLLDISRIITGNLRLNSKYIEFGSVIQTAIDSIRPAIDAKNILLHVVLDPTANKIKGDPTRLQQVIWNLLSNAVKFTPKGGNIEIRLGRSGSDAQLTVADSGEGIDPGFLPYVFDRFLQADGSITRKHGGLGLGLAIARNLIEMHGGQIEASSAGLGKGSTFTVTLPLMPLSINESPVKQESPREATASAALVIDKSVNLSGLRILAVDDEGDTREMLIEMLEQYGAEVITAGSTKEAMETLPTWKPDILVSDIGMPEEDGYALIRKVRMLEPNQGGAIPAIALTGYARVEERLHALTSGYQMFVPKPVEAGELASIIQDLTRTESSETRSVS